MFLAIQFVGFCNQPYLQNKVSQVMRLRNWLYLKNELMEWTDILHAGANSEKLKVILIIFGWAWLEMDVTV